MGMGKSGLRELLEEHADEKYRSFQCGLIPTVDPGSVLGVRVPELRRIARELAHDGPAAARELLGPPPHETYEEGLLHALLVNEMRDYDACVAALNEFLPFVDNWATCDILAPRAFEVRPVALPAQAEGWMADEEHPYAVRFGVGVLMRLYLDDAFDPIYLGRVCALRSGEYYVNMMVAWYVATALAKQWEATLSVLEGRLLAPWTHNKAIQKAVESRRVTPEHKRLLRTLRV